MVIKLEDKKKSLIRLGDKKKSLIRLGPSKIGMVKDIENTFKDYYDEGLRAAEIPFTYGIFIKKKEDMEKVRKASEKFNIKLSIHAPYWINLNSKEEIKIRQSKDRILRCCEIGDKIGAYRVVFHPGYYIGMEKEQTFQNIKKAILEMQEEIKKNKWNVKLAPEVMGKINVFGSVKEIARLVCETKCKFCLDFAHIEAREGKIDFDNVKKLFGEEKFWHCHFSGIEYGEKGEKKHIKTKKEKWKELFKNLPANKEITIINEAPDTIGDSLEGLDVLNN